MYSQFFGNYLLSKHAVSTDQLIAAIENEHARHIKLGTLAMHAGLMDAKQVDDIIIQQTHEDKKFGDLAVEKGYLSREEVNSLLEVQTPDYLLIGQYFVDNGILSNEQLSDLIHSYQEENQLAQLDEASEQKDNLNELIRNLCLISLADVPSSVVEYLDLLFHDLIRFIGEDFTPLTPSVCSEYLTTHCSSQVVSGEFSLVSYFDMTEDTAIAFASRYVHEAFTEYDEYVEASLEDFLNLHNGLFSVNVSNDSSVELQLQPPVSMENTLLSCSANSILLPIIYPFGTLNFLIKYQPKIS